MGGIPTVAAVCGLLVKVGAKIFTSTIIPFETVECDRTSTISEALPRVPAV
jgi:hypothetical protein